MTGRARKRWERSLADEASTSALLLLAISIAFGAFGLFGAARISRFLEAIADVEHFHDLTMID